MKVLVDVCDECGGSRGIVLSSEYEMHHLCEDCAARFLEAIFNTASVKFVPFDEGAVVGCVFCSDTWSSGSSSPFLFLMKSDSAVCSTCLLEAARKMGNLRLVRDSVRDC